LDIFAKGFIIWPWLKSMRRFNMTTNPKADLTLTPAQQAAVAIAARQLLPRARGAFINDVEQALRGCSEINEGNLYIAIKAALAQSFHQRMVLL
jgi:hypothetical protein